MMSNSPTGSHLFCRRCGHADPDLRIIGCSCLLHARCTPLSLVIEQGAPYQYGGIPTPVKSNGVLCPVCRCGTVNGLQLLHMGLQDLERAIELRTMAEQARADATAKNANAGVGKRSRDDFGEGDSFHHIQSDSAYLLLSHSKAPGARDHQNDRTGRWSVDEVAFVDQVALAFDQGSLPLPHGVKLNEFLGDMLLCKSSRLTKKMKNAKLSTRSFVLKNEIKCLTDEECASLSTLQDKFLKSVSSEPMQLELKFIITKLWRTHFSNLCLQVGYEMLDASEWLTSLEEMERRASDVEDLVRAVRRRRMGMALRQDVGPGSTDGVFIGGLPANRGLIAPQVTFSSDIVAEMDSQVVQQTSNLKSDISDDPGDFLANLDMETGSLGRPRTLSEDFLTGFEDLEDPINMVSDAPPPPVNELGDCGPFLDKVIRYVERQNLPFEHADLWVASHVSDGQDGDDSAESVRLFHAGHATRSDLDSLTSSQLNEYGVYSTNFSFAPGVGLPGRVYVNGQPSWECRVDNADPARFERAGGAQVYGVKTAVGIPLEAVAVGRIVLALYSTRPIEENRQQLERFSAEFAKWIPEPRWKLVVELGEKSKKPEFEKKVESSASQTAHIQAGAAMVSSASLSTDMKAVSESTPTPQSFEDIDHHIATLLGDHMPLNEGSSNASMLQHFMHLRLLLLRPEGRRTQQENELVDIVKQSFMGFSKDKKRQDSELALLLVRDWMFLSSSFQQVTAPLPVVQQHSPLCPPLQAPSGQPMQSGALNYGDSSKLMHWRHGFDEHASSKPTLLTGPGRSREVSPTVVPDG